MLLPSADVLGFFPEYRSTQIAWQGLTPAGAWLIRELRPARLVELGSYRGDSFFTFMQAARDIPEVKELWAVDSWQGDQHTGAYEDSVFDQFEAERTRRDDPRATPLRMFFDEALERFEDGSIDLLHIDGAHDYDSVARDFRSWLPKMKTDGVIAFHDTVVRTGDFGVWKLWEEIESEYPGRVLNLTHSNGLGILCLGQATDNQIQRVCALPEAGRRMVADALAIAGRNITDLTNYEHDFTLRNGGQIEDGHIYSSDTGLEAMQSLHRMDAERAASGPGVRNAIGAGIEKLLNEQAGDVYAALAPQVREEVGVAIDAILRENAGDIYAALGTHVREEIGTEIEKLFRERTDDVYAALESRIRATASDRIEDLLRSRSGDMFDAMEPRLRQNAHDAIEIMFREHGSDVYASIQPRLDEQMQLRIETILRNHVDDLYAAMSPKLAAAMNDRIEELLRSQSGDVYAALSPHVREAIGHALDENSPFDSEEFRDSVRMAQKPKTDAQDDAILGIGAKVDAHEQGIEILRDYLQQVFQHPLFK